MDLAGQGKSPGYAMAALLIAMSVMAVLMGALLPVWTHMVTRDKEEELIFRGNQYARAIGLFQRKFANAAPPTIDLLVEQRFLRKKYKDPITRDDFQPIYANQAPQRVSAPSGALRPGQQASESLATPTPQQQGLQSGFNSTGVGAAGGIIGVTSKSKEQSIKIYNGRQRYNEWQFVHLQTAQRPGGPGGPGAPPGARPGIPPGAQRPGGIGGSGSRPFGPEQPNRMPGPMPSPFGPGPGPRIGPGPGIGQPGRPPAGSPGGNVFTPAFPGQQQPPPGVRPPG